METLTIKDIICVLLHTKPFQTGDELRQWKIMKNSFVDVIKDKFPNNQKIIDELNEIVEEK